MNRSLLLLAMLFLSPTAPALAQTRKLNAARKQMVKMISEGVKDQRVLEAIGQTQRHQFVPASERRNAYYDMALPIGNGATISPPYVVAFMTEQLDPQPTDKVLEIGTGSGYQAAVLSPLVAEVYSIEIIEPLGKQAAERLKRLRYKNITTKIGDGFQGWAEHAPFDKIIVTCSPEKIPTPLVEQLKEGGRMVIPLGERFQQALCLVRKKNGKLTREVLESTFFIPMTGRAEELRVVKESDIPEVLNGGFEKATTRQQPLNWYYLRQSIIKSDDAPVGKSYLSFRNETQGRMAQALQAFGVSGEKHRQLDVSVWVKSTEVKSGNSIEQSPWLDLRFYDEKRRNIGKTRIGPFLGTTLWSKQHRRVAVPRRAKLAVLGIGMFGATGQADFDEIKVQTVAP